MLTTNIITRIILRLAKKHKIIQEIKAFNLILQANIKYSHVYNIPDILRCALTFHNQLKEKQIQQKNFLNELRTILKQLEVKIILKYLKQSHVDEIIINSKAPHPTFGYINSEWDLYNFLMQNTHTLLFQDCMIYFCKETPNKENSEFWFKHYDKLDKNLVIQ